MASFVLVVSVDGHGRSTAQGRVSFPLTLCPINVDFLGAPSSPVSMTADCSRTLQRTGRWNLGSCRRRLYCKHGGLVSLLRTGGFWSERCRRSLRTSEQSVESRCQRKCLPWAPPLAHPTQQTLVLFVRDQESFLFRTEKCRLWRRLHGPPPLALRRTQHQKLLSTLHLCRRHQYFLPRSGWSPST